MRSLGVVFDAPRFDGPARVYEADEPVLVEALVAVTCFRFVEPFIPGKWLGWEGREWVDGRA